MINERIAIVVLEGEIPKSDNDPHHTKQFYKSIQNFADASLHLCEVGKTKKFEEHLKVALRLFREGNETVKSAIINVYLFTISHALDKQAQLVKYAERIFPKELMTAYNKLHYTSGV
jgi:hypothetical protein